MSTTTTTTTATNKGFAITPHKVSICVLLQIYAPPAQISVPFPFSSVHQHNRLALFLFSLTKSCDDIFEPKLDQLISQLRQVGGLLSDWLVQHLTSRLSSLLSPDDLFNFFTEMRGILGGLESGAIEDDQILLDPNSNLGMFLRRCILAFNMLPFEGVCHLLTNVGNYCKDPSSYPSFEMPHADNSSNDLEAISQYENMDLENIVFEKVAEEIEERKRASKNVPFHFQVPKALSALIEDIEVSADLKLKYDEKARETCMHPHYTRRNPLRGNDSSVGTFLNINWQIQGYLAEQADAIEKHGSSFPLNAFELVLRQLQKLAPDLHRAHFLRYLNNLYHDDYFSAIENLHCYFDYSAGTEGFDNIPPSGYNSAGRYELALVYLGMMHIHFGHPKQALEVLTEAVRVSQQQGNDICLAYTLAAICNLLSEVGISSTTGILESSQSPMISIGSSLPVQQQLFVLLKGSLKRAESLKLKRLEAYNHLAMAKFHLTHVQRPLLSFGPKTSLRLKNSPIDVCKELRSSYRLITDFGSESPLTATDGAFSTSWLKSLQKPLGSILSEDSECGNSTNALRFCAQPSSIPESVLQLTGSSYLIRATAWEIYGSSSLARINALIYATCFFDSSSTSDGALVYVKLIQHLATFKGYKDAFSALKMAEEKFFSISKSRILLLKLQLLHEYALHRGRLKLAHRICDELGVMASPATGVDMDLKIEASLRHARTLLAAKQFSQAAAVAHSLFCMCYKFNLQVENATVLLLLAEIHKKSGNTVLALPYVLASLSFCQSFNLDLLKASATLTLAELWLSLGSTCANRALNLIHGVLPIILGHGGLELRARGFIAEAKCYLSDPSFSVIDNSELVLDPLRQASEELEVLEYHELAAEAFYLMALIFDKLGQPENREEASFSFKKHMIALDNPQDGEDDITYMT